MVHGSGIVTLSILKASEGLDMEQTSGSARHFTVPLPMRKVVVSDFRSFLGNWNANLFLSKIVLCSLRIKPKLFLEQFVKYHIY